MCGLFAIAKFGGVNEIPTKGMDKNTLLKLVEELALANMARGHDATGVMLAKEDWKEIPLLKRPIQASRFIKTPEFEDWSKEVDPETYRLIIGHTRQSTGGDPKYNVNNHPIVCGKFAGVHNGFVTNDDAVFEYENLYRKGKVDSEALFAIMNKYYKDFPKMAEALHKKINWTGVALSLSPFYQGSLFVSCAGNNTNNLYLGWLPQYKTAIFSSTKISIVDVVRDTLDPQTTMNITEASIGGLYRFNLLCSKPHPVDEAKFVCT
jgi:glutamine phosphoribosylpyrophosphate amidotransferase